MRSTVDSGLRKVPSNNLPARLVAGSAAGYDQLGVIEAAMKARCHLGIWCDVTGARPIRGTRYTRPGAGDSYDLCEAAWRALGEEETQAINAVGGGGGGGGTSAGGAASKRRKKGESQKKVKKVKPSAEEIVALRLVRKQRKEVKEQFNAQRDAFVARLTALELDALEDYQMDGGGKKRSG